MPKSKADPDQISNPRKSDKPISQRYESMTRIIFNSALGEFEIALDTDRAPVTCSYFSELIRNGTLEDSQIFRIVAASNHESNDPCPIHVVQIGSRQGISADKQQVRHEGTNLTGISHKKWTVSAARIGAGELYGSFFICMRDEPALDHGGMRQTDGQGFAAFGQVVSGFETVERLYRYSESEEMLKTGIPIHVALLGKSSDKHLDPLSQSSTTQF